MTKAISCSPGNRMTNHNTEKCRASPGKQLVEKIDRLQGKSRVSTPRGLETEAGHTSRALFRETNHPEVPAHLLEGWRGRGASDEEEQTHGFGSMSFGRAVTNIDRMPQKASSLKKLELGWQEGRSAWNILLEDLQIAVCQLLCLPPNRKSSEFCLILARGNYSGSAFGLL